MSYRFKVLEEAVWAGVVSASLVVLQVLSTLDPATVTDWRTWGFALAGGMIRAAAGAMLAYASRVQDEDDDPPHLTEIPPGLVSLLADELERRNAEREGGR